MYSDDEKRAQYDQYGDADTFKKASGFSGFDPGAFGGFDFSDFASFDFGDIFDRFFGGGGGGGSQGFGRRGRRASRGNDLRYDMEITLEEAAFGVEKEITIPRNEQCPDCKGSGAADEDSISTCPDCNGSGYVRRTQRTHFGIFSTSGPCGKCRGEGKYIKEECKECDGTGLVHTRKKITLKIPPGAEEGTNLRIAGAGEAGERGGTQGDLYIVLHMKQHPVFEREGDDIHAKVKLPFTVAALGGEIDVPTLEGKARLKIPPGTQSNTVLRMREKGIPYLHNHGRGDELVEVVIEVPDHLTKKQKKLLEDFAKEGSKGILGKVFG
ncbi:molecular chaperone DnaJ [Candidatus Woesearchaeota archaeon]|nr:molecular chaperone DnaJ [Candidatus Woesearchaeota archaeon]